MICKQITIVIFANLLAITFACRGGRLIRNGLVGSIDKFEILKAHNDYRDEVALGKILRQPSAENMLEMQWDDELAQVAQRWADECIYLHNMNRSINRFDFGENLAIELYSEITELRDNGNEFPSRVQLWFEEYKLYTFGQGFSKDTGHYTQIIWAETFLVGCGFAYYKGADGFYARFYVCNYGPGGNIRGELPYVTGDPSCYKHGLKPSQQYRGLCQASSSVPVAATDKTISNDIELLVGHAPFITSFTPTTTEDYTTKLTFPPISETQTFTVVNKQPVKLSQQQTTILPNTITPSTYQLIPITNSLMLGTNKPSPKITNNPSISESKVREVNITLTSLPDILLPSTTYTPITTQQLPSTTIIKPFLTTAETTNQAVTPNTDLSNSFESSHYNNLPLQTTTARNYQYQTATTFHPYQFSPLPIPLRPKIRPNISPREYEAIIYNHHRALLNNIFQRQQQRTAQTLSYVINSGPKSPYFTYKWSDLFN